MKTGEQNNLFKSQISPYITYHTANTCELYMLGKMYEKQHIGERVQSVSLIFPDSKCKSHQQSKRSQNHWIKLHNTNTFNHDKFLHQKQNSQSSASVQTESFSGTNF